MEPVRFIVYKGILETNIPEHKLDTYLGLGWVLDKKVEKALSDYTVAELKTLANGKGLQYNYNIRKNDLIALLEQKEPEINIGDIKPSKFNDGLSL